MSTLKLDKRVLKTVERGLGLQAPTHIRHVRFMTGQNPISEMLAEMTTGMRAGAQYMRTIHGKHRIEVRNDLRRYDADVALNHELRHAHQLERLGGNEQFQRAYRLSTAQGCWRGGCGCLREDCRVGYERNAYEVEARHYEDWHRFHRTLPRLHQRPSRGTILGRR